MAYLSSQLADGPLSIKEKEMGEAQAIFQAPRETTMITTMKTMNSHQEQAVQLGRGKLVEARNSLLFLQTYVLPFLKLITIPIYLSIVRLPSSQWPRTWLRWGRF